MNKFKIRNQMRIVLFVLIFFNVSMNWFSKDINKDWTSLSEPEQLSGLIIYKHSSRCGLSTMTENKLEEGWDLLKPKVKLYFLDLIRNREVSNSVAERFNVRHQSPQILIIKNGICVYNSSHYEINVETILKNL